MKHFNSTLVRVMLPLVVIVALISFITTIVTKHFIQETVDSVYISSEVEHLKEMIQSKIDATLITMIKESMLVATCPDTQSFLQSQEAKDGKLSEDMQRKLQYFKNFYNLETVYIAELHTRNYFKESGFIRKVAKEGSDDQWFDATLLQEKPYTINIDTFETDSLTIWIDTKVYSADKLVGLAGGGIKIKNILSPIESLIHKLGATVYLFDQDMILRSSINSPYPLEKNLQELPLSDQRRQHFLELILNDTELLNYTQEGETHFLLGVPLQSLGWNIVIDFSNASFIDPLQGVSERIFTSGLITVATILFFGWIAFIHLIQRPLKTLTDTLENFDYKSKFPLNESFYMGSELNQIILAFQKSSALLQETLHDYKTSEELLRNVTNATQDLIFYKDLQQKFIGCNKAYSEWMGRGESEIIGFTDYQLYPFTTAQKHFLADQEVIKKRKTIIIEEEFSKITTEDKEDKIILQISKSPLLDNNDQVKGVVGVARDITHIKFLEQELRQLNTVLEKRVLEQTQELQHSNKELENSISILKDTNTELKKAKQKAQLAVEARSNFLSSISHELRTPMNAIINFTDQVVEDFDEIVSDPTMHDEAKMFLQRVLINSKHLLQLINELLEFTKADSGNIDYDIKKHEINDIVTIAYKNTRSLVEESDTLTYRVQNTQEPLYAQVDSRRLLQVLLNLLSNAIKFTNTGSIDLRCYQHKKYVIIEVEDTGRGIAKEKQQSIFNPFIQANRNDPGTGLGLGLVQRMCDDMHIKISLSSREDKGSTFTLFIKAE